MGRGKDALNFMHGSEKEDLKNSNACFFGTCSSGAWRCHRLIEEFIHFPGYKFYA